MNSGWCPYLSLSEDTAQNRSAVTAMMSIMEDENETNLLRLVTTTVGKVNN